MHSPNRLEVTIDDALQNSVGECGRGQLHALGLASIATVVAALINFSFVFTGIDPFRSSQSECFPGTKESCDPAKTRLCAAPRETWDWKYRYVQTLLYLLSDDATAVFVHSYLGTATPRPIKIGSDCHPGPV